MNKNESYYMCLMKKMTNNYGWLKRNDTHKYMKTVIKIMQLLIKLIEKRVAFFAIAQYYNPQEKDKYL